MQNIIGIYVIAIGAIITSMFGFWFAHDPRGYGYAAIFNMLGIAVGLIASCLRSQHRCIEQIESRISQIRIPENG